MASATGIPQLHPDSIASREDSPLLSTPGNEPQSEDNAALYPNLFRGTALAAQVGIWLIAILVWAGILSHPLIFFSAHPLLNSAALLLQVQATLILQPTSTASQKRRGTIVHYSIQALSVLGFLAAFLIIEINKGDHARLTSPHGVLGLVTYILIILQATGGVVQYFLPLTLLGSVERGKTLYKYHRQSGYLLLVLELATVVAATRTTFNVNVLGISLWGVVVGAVLVVIGVGARIRKHKLGY
ncbi:cytochrome b561 domain-containing protein [Aspergillus saccharolyticus JOP 1030-1]|uniref:Cytochrome b561 n=1 Tax=Aspergillus saccharolyticus JOP 1030-1 TaxID=1450539 RepID=A0A318ZGP7_9EURO|nr:cytochrome b561 [Aspergillus saccharolyticus JOP 1030-1]PYH45544.1 cytochrome b561 [Aspergillus saccharolyticus JOP 1030-1]